MERALPNNEALLSARIDRFYIVDPDHTAGPDIIGGCRHVEYAIIVLRGEHSYTIRKRFSEFSELHSSLVSHFGQGITFSLPPKTFFRCFCRERLEERRRGLSVYLTEICDRQELLACPLVLKFFEPQLRPEWGVAAEPCQRGFLGGVLDITRGGRRSAATLLAAVQMINEHKAFKAEVAAMLQRGASEEELHSRSSAYLTAMAQRIRDMMLRNGGFQVKMGQAIASQKALLPQEVTETLAACCDKARALPLRAIEGAVTTQLGRPLSEVFASVSDEPLAAASIAQVHHATLQGSGDEVVLKVVHPGVAESMRADVAFMPHLIRMVERVEPNHGLHPLAVTWESMLKQELDMRREGQNRERLAAVVERSGRSGRSEHADVLFPRVYWELCREGLMVQEFARGAVALTSQTEAEAAGVPYRLAVAELAELFGETAFVHGYLHNDLHPGNVLVRPQAGAEPSLSPRERRAAVLAALLALYLVIAAAGFALARVALALLWTVLDGLSGFSLVGCVPVITAIGAVGVTCNVAGARASLRSAPGAVLVLCGQGLGLHFRLRGRVERAVARAAKTRFDLIIIDHGFHTYLPYEFRITWCKVWAAIGLCDEALLREAAAELNLVDDEYRVLPTILCLLPYSYWLRHEFPGPQELLKLLKDEECGLPRCRFLDRKMPPAWHLVMRVNGQVSALFQMQFGVTPTTRYEFMRFMTRSALMGLRFKSRPIGEMPVPGCLSTADRAFFERELPHVEEQMEAGFRWTQNIQVQRWEASRNFVKGLVKEIASEDAKQEAERSAASVSTPPSASSPP